MTSKFGRWGSAAVVVVALLVGVVALVQFILGLIGGYRCDQPAKTLVDMRSMDHLSHRFNDDAGSPRLILLLSPT
jgi:hypothetical protein